MGGRAAHPALPAARGRRLLARRPCLVTCVTMPGQRHPSPADLLASAKKGQLLRVQLSGSPNPLWLETVAVRKGGVEVLCEGELLRLLPGGGAGGGGGALAAEHLGHWPRFADAWVKKCPSLQAALQRLRQQQAEAGLPSQQLREGGVAALAAVTTLEQLQLDVRACPALWCDGAGANAPALTEEQQQLLTAGELVAFLQGLRGVVIVQLDKGWGEQGAGRQPLLRSYVLQLLQRAAGDKGVLMLPSQAAGGLGLSLLLCPKQQPFRARAEYLARMGVQSSLVADSPYYKYLIGRILGYPAANCIHHIESSGGVASSQMVEAVEQEIASMSSVAPKLPWTSKNSRR